VARIPERRVRRWHSPSEEEEEEEEGMRGVWAQATGNRESHGAIAREREREAGVAWEHAAWRAGDCAPIERERERERERQE